MWGGFGFDSSVRSAGDERLGHSGPQNPENALGLVQGGRIRTGLPVPLPRGESHQSIFPFYSLFSEIFVAAEAVVANQKML